LIAVPQQQAAIRQMRRMKDRGLSLRGAGIKISHMTVKNTLDAAASGPNAGELIEGPPRLSPRSGHAPRGRAGSSGG
jgi:hypothetical protein